MMKVKPADPTAIIRDPHTRVPLPVDGDDVPETTFWTRRFLAGEVLKWNGKAWVSATLEAELAKLALEGVKTPTGNEPVAPLTTRGGK